MEIIIGIVAVAAIYIYSTMSSKEPEQKQAAPELAVSGDSTIYDAIRRGIVGPLGLPTNAAPILFAQYILETNHGKAWYFPTTKSLFNRHTGSGRGDWIGSGKPESAWVQGVDYIYVSAGDPNIRCFRDVYQSARDMAQLLSDPLYCNALAGLRRGSAPDYFNALHQAGFSTQSTYASSLQRVYDSIA